jgi:hypothetical protein
MSNSSLRKTINRAIQHFPKELEVLVTEQIAKAWEAGRTEAQREQISKDFARDKVAFGHPADDYERKEVEYE